ncbi:MAG: hypothetical protein V8S74_05335 [Lachnospirales bacterium]
MEKIQDLSFINVFSLDIGEIYWNDLDFDIGVKYMTLKQKRQRIKRAIELKNILFKCLYYFNEEVFIVPKFDFENNYFEWFNLWKDIHNNFYYKKIIDEANKRGIYLKTYKKINLLENKDLGRNFFEGNLNYVSRACYFIPKYEIAIEPTHSLELNLYGSLKKDSHKNIVDMILNENNKLKFSM